LAEGLAQPIVFLREELRVFDRETGCRSSLRLGQGAEKRVIRRRGILAAQFHGVKSDLLAAAFALLPEEIG
jgi:hypothetical protein